LAASRRPGSPYDVTSSLSVLASRTTDVSFPSDHPTAVGAGTAIIPVPPASRLLVPHLQRLRHTALRPLIIVDRS